MHSILGIGTSPGEQKKKKYKQVKLRWKDLNGALKFLLFTNITSAHQIMLVSSRAYFERIYLSLVEVVNQVLNDSGGVGGLDALTVVGDNGARGSAGHDDTLLTLKRKDILAPISPGGHGRGNRAEPPMGAYLLAV